MLAVYLVCAIPFVREMVKRYNDAAPGAPDAKVAAFFWDSRNFTLAFLLVTLVSTVGSVTFFITLVEKDLHPAVVAVFSTAILFHCIEVVLGFLLSASFCAVSFDDVSEFKIRRICQTPGQDRSFDRIARALSVTLTIWFSCSLLNLFLTVFSIALIAVNYDTTIFPRIQNEENAVIAFAVITVIIRLLVTFFLGIPICSRCCRAKQSSNHPCDPCWSGEIKVYF